MALYSHNPDLCYPLCIFLRCFCEENCEYRPKAALVTPNYRIIEFWGAIWSSSCPKWWKNYSTFIVQSSVKQSKSKIVLWFHLGFEGECNGPKGLPSCYTGADTAMIFSPSSKHSNLVSPLALSSLPQKRTQAGSFAASRIWSWLQGTAAVHHCVFWQVLSRISIYILVTFALAEQHIVGFNSLHTHAPLHLVEASCKNAVNTFGQTKQTPGLWQHLFFIACWNKIKTF